MNSDENFHITGDEREGCQLDISKQYSHVRDGNEKEEGTF